MNQLARVGSAVTTRYSPNQLQLIRDTIAKGLTSAMFDQFMETAALRNLDPLKKQIVPIVFRKRELDAVTGKWGWQPYLNLITTIDGYRAIADRTGNYRPDTEPPRFTYREDLKNADTNPLGIESCEVSVFKFAHGDWHRHTAVAYWDEYVPLKKVDGRGKGANDGPRDEGDPQPDRDIIDPGTQWPRRPRGQLAKCTEALALRRGWPEDFSGLYVEDEMDRAKTIEAEYQDMTPSQAAENAAVEQRLEAVQRRGTLLFDWFDSKGLTLTPLGEVADRCFAFIREHQDELVELADFRERNQHSLREFWAKSKGDALAVKKGFDDAIEAARKKAVDVEADGGEAEDHKQDAG